MPQAYSFYPSPKRRFIGNVVFFLIFLLGHMLFNSFSFGYFLALSGIFLVVALMFAYDNSLAIKIINDTISGPSLSGFKQVEFELASVDKDRTKAQSLWRKINGQTIIYAKDGQKIQIAHSAFTKNKRAEILDIIILRVHSINYGQRTN